jgi:hypothetical protein
METSDQSRCILDRLAGPAKAWLGVLGLNHLEWSRLGGRMATAVDRALYSTITTFALRISPANASRTQ